MTGGPKRHEDSIEHANLAGGNCRGLVAVVDRSAPVGGRGRRLAHVALRCGSNCGDGRRIIRKAIHLVLFSFCLISIAELRGEETFSVSDGKTEAAVDAKGNLVTLKNLATGRNFAGGEALWRLYYDKKDGQLENQLTSGDCSAKVGKTDNSLVLKYDRFVDRGTPLAFELVLTITIEDGLVRFASEVKNGQPHTIIRELQYPLVRNTRLPDDFKLLTTRHGGQLFPNPRGYVNAAGNRTSYAAPAQFFRDTSLRYPGATASNCFAFTGEKEGLYFGSHDNSFQDTIHGLRIYPGHGPASSMGEERLHNPFFRGSGCGS